MDTKQAKQRFGIIGNDSELIRAIDVALQVAPTDISVFVYGESGTGKENIPKIIHQNSKRKHSNYVTVIVAQFQRALLIPNFSDMKKAPLQVHTKAEKDTLKWRIVVLFS